MKENNRKHLYCLSVAALMLALGYLLPYVTAGIPEIGNMLLPMHIPVMLCGLICGWKYGLAVGAVLPVFRSLTVGMPALYPRAVGMAFELAGYGLIIGLCFALFKKKNYLSLAVSLLLAQLGGRVIWGIARAIMSGAGNSSFTFAYFLINGFLEAWPGILLQWLLIPTVMMVLLRSKALAKLQ